MQYVLWSCVKKSMYKSCFEVLKEKREKERFVSILQWVLVDT